MTYSNITNAVNSGQKAIQLNSDARVKNLESWANFSTTASKLLGEYEEQVAKNDEAEGYNDFIENGLSDEEAEAYNKEKASVDEESDQITVLGTELQQQGINRDVWSSLKNRSRAYQLGAAKALAQRAGEIYPMHLQSFRADTTKQYTSPIGERFTIGTATPAQYRYALSLNRKQFLMDSGLMYINKGLVNELGVRRILIDSDNKAIISQKRRYDINASEMSQQEIMSEFNSGGDFFTTVGKLKLELNPNTGLPNSYSDVMRIMEKQIKLWAANGEDEKISRLKDTIIPEGSPGAGKRLGDFRAQWFKKIELEARQGKLNRWDTDEAERRQQKTELSRSYIAEALANPRIVTDEWLKQKQLVLQGLGLGRSRALDQLGATLNVDGLNDEADVERLGNLAMSGKITMDDLNGVSWKVWQQFYPYVQRLQQKPGISKNLKKAIEELEGEINSALGGVIPGKNSTDAGLLKQELETLFYKHLNELKVANPGVDEEVLINPAKVKASDEFQAGKTDPTSIFHIDQGGAPNLRTRARNSAQSTQRVRQLAQSKGKAALQDPALYGMTAQQIEDIDPTNLPQIFIDVGTLFGEHPAYVYNEALKGIGSSKPPLNVPVSNVNLPTSNRVLRAFLAHNQFPNLANFQLALNNMPVSLPAQLTVPQTIYRQSAGMMLVNNGNRTQQQINNPTWPWLRPGEDKAYNLAGETLDHKAGLAVINSTESGGPGKHFKLVGGVLVPELLDMTIQEVWNMAYKNRDGSSSRIGRGVLPQRFDKNGKPQYVKYGASSHAVGAYQFHPGTMLLAAKAAGIPLTAKFTYQVQQELALAWAKELGARLEEGPTRRNFQILGSGGAWEGVGKMTYQEFVDSWHRYRQEAASGQNWT